MSVIKYDFVQLSLTKINSVTQEPVYSDDGIDYLYTKFDLDINAVVNMDAKPSMLNAAVDDAATINEYISALRQQLLQPRKFLHIELGADSAIYNQATIGALQTLLVVSAPDAKGGPFPKACNIRQVGGSKTLLIQFQIQTFVFDQVCANREEPKKVLSNRWEMNFSYDTEGMATRTTRGTIIVNGSQPDINADDFRGWIIPKIPTGWRRKRMDFNLSSDGLKVGYTIEDAEQYYAFPEGCTTVEGTYTESTTKTGAILYVDMDVTVKGPKNVEKEWLIQKALQLIDSRIDWAALPRDNETNKKDVDVLESGSISEDLFENKVNAKIRVYKGAGNVGNRKAVQSTLGKFGKPLSYENFLKEPTELSQDGVTGYVETYGTAGIKAIYSAWATDACTDPNRLDTRTTVPEPESNGDTESTEGPPTPPPDTTVTVNEESAYNESQAFIKKSLEHQKYPYTDCEIKQDLKTDFNIKPLPVQKPPTKDPWVPSPGSIGPPVRPYPADKQPSFGPTPSPPWEMPQSSYWTPPDAIMLTQPMQTRTISFNAERAGAWPLVPRAYERLYSGEILTRKHVQADPPTVGADGQTYIYSVSGVYEYFSQHYVDEQSQDAWTWAGKLQWTYEPFPDEYNPTSPVFGIPPGNFQPLIADAETLVAFTDEELGIA